MVRKWSIYYADLNPTKGSKQKEIRPVLVVSNNNVNKYLPICTVVPFSSCKKDTKIYPTEMFIPLKESGLGKDSILMFQQIRTIDSAKLKIPEVGALTNINTQRMINDKIMKYFEL